MGGVGKVNPPMYIILLSNNISLAFWKDANVYKTEAQDIICTVGKLAAQMHFLENRPRLKRSDIGAVKVVCGPYSEEFTKLHISH